MPGFLRMVTGQGRLVVGAGRDGGGGPRPEAELAARRRRAGSSGWTPGSADSSSSFWQVPGHVMPLAAGAGGLATHGPEGVISQPEERLFLTTEASEEHVGGIPEGQGTVGIWAHPLPTLAPGKRPMADRGGPHPGRTQSLARPGTGLGAPGPQASPLSLPSHRHGPGQPPRQQ